MRKHTCDKNRHINSKINKFSPEKIDVKFPKAERQNPNSINKLDYYFIFLYCLMFL